MPAPGSHSGCCCRYSSAPGESPGGRWPREDARTHPANTSNDRMEIDMTNTRMTREGAPVKVARTQNQSEAELVQRMLLAEGVPSVLRRAPGFDVPDFLAAGPRDVLVPASYAEVARDVLLQDDPEPHAAQP